MTDPQFAEVVRRDGPALWPSYQERPVVWGWKLAAAEAREIKLRKRDQSREPPPQPEERPIEDPPVLSRIREAVRGATTPANLFYDRNNLLLSPSEGPTPGNHFAVIVKNQEEMRQAGHNVWREGFAGERLVYRRLEEEGLKEWGLE